MCISMPTQFYTISMVGKFLHYGFIVLGIVRNDMANLYVNGQDCNHFNYYGLSLTLFWMPTCQMTLNRAWLSHSPFCALLIFRNLISAPLSCHSIDDDSSIQCIQCTVTAKYPLALYAYHASQVRLTSPLTVGPYKYIHQGQVCRWQ